MKDSEFYASFRDVLPGKWHYDGSTPIDQDGYFPVSEQLIELIVAEAKEGRSLGCVAEHINLSAKEDERLAQVLICGLVPSLQMRFLSSAVSDDEYQAMKGRIYPHLSDAMQSVWRHWESVDE